ncbi:probable salivary secreted peptide [Periplaneta americana]|uniref:probable salivary secreted peptide n=1 Tax=Periplaneta americana TaxID=6978 RepID=UPI0037E89313
MKTQHRVETGRLSKGNSPDSSRAATMSKPVTSLVLVLLLASLCAGQRHSLMKCNSRPGDRLLLDRSVSRSSKFLSKVSDTVRYSGSETINCIEAIDGWNDDTGGYAEIVDGGLGQRHVAIKITSRNSRGFHFFVKVYGH